MDANDKAALIAKGQELGRHEVPQLGEGLYIRALRWDESGAYEIYAADLIDKAKNDNAIVTLSDLSCVLVCFSLRNPDDSLVFAPDDWRELKKFNKRTLFPIIAKAKELCDISNDDIKELKKSSQKVTTPSLSSDSQPS